MSVVALLGQLLSVRWWPSLAQVSLRSCCLASVLGRLYHTCGFLRRYQVAQFITVAGIALFTVTYPAS